MTKAPAQSIAYILKRYPRLSETFILNEIRALERLGTKLHIFSLLQTEERLTHPSVGKVQAPVTYFPAAWFKFVFAVAKAHADLAVHAPLRYLRGIGFALLWSLRSPRPHTVWKQFFRSGYIARACRDEGVGHIHAHFANAPSLVANFVSVMGAIPYSFTAHAKDLYLTPKRVVRRRISSASFVLTCTRYNLEYLRTVARSRDWGKLHIVYHGIDLEQFRSARVTGEMAAEAINENEVTPLILSVGRLVPKKGMGDLVSACHLLRMRGVRFHCSIVGAGPLRGQLEAQIKELGLDDIVLLPGAMAHDVLVSLYERASVFALAPHITEDGDRDGIPNVLAEAMAAGVPVVSTSVSGIPELVENGRTGLLTPPRDTEALADAVECLLANATLRQKLAAAARRRVEAGFECWENAKQLQVLLPASAPS